MVFCQIFSLREERQIDVHLANVVALINQAVKDSFRMEDQFFSTFQ